MRTSPFLHRYAAWSVVRPVVAGGGEHLAAAWNLVDNTQPATVLPAAPPEAGPVRYAHDSNTVVDLYVRLSTPLPPGMQAVVRWTMDASEGVRLLKTGDYSAAEGFWYVEAVLEDWDPAALCWNNRPVAVHALRYELLAGWLDDGGAMRWAPPVLEEAGGDAETSETVAVVSMLRGVDALVYGFRLRCDFNSKSTPGFEMRVDGVAGCDLVL